MSNGGEILAHKISLKGLAIGSTHARQLTGQGAGGYGRGSRPRFVWLGVGPQLTFGLISREQRREICWGAPGLEFRSETHAGLELELAARFTGAWATRMLGWSGSWKEFRPETRAGPRLAAGFTPGL